MLMILVQLREAPKDWVFHQNTTRAKPKPKTKNQKVLQTESTQPYLTKRQKIEVALCGSILIDDL